MLFGLFITYNWGKIPVKGKISLAVIVIGEKLNVAFDVKSKIQENLSKFKSGEFYTQSYNLNDISHFWRYTVNLQTTFVNKTTYSDNIKVLNNSKKEEVVDFSDLSMKLSHKDYLIIVNYLKSFKSSLIFENP